MAITASELGIATADIIQQLMIERLLAAGSLGWKPGGISASGSTR